MHKDDFYPVVWGVALDPDFPKYLPYEAIAKVSPELASLAYASRAYFDGDARMGDKMVAYLREVGTDRAALKLLAAERALLIDNDRAKAAQLLADVLSASDTPVWVRFVAEADKDMFSNNP